VRRGRIRCSRRAQVTTAIAAVAAVMHLHRRRRGGGRGVGSLLLDALRGERVLAPVPYPSLRGGGKRGILLVRFIYFVSESNLCKERTLDEYMLMCPARPKPPRL
jgi:hypothetical protein